MLGVFFHVRGFFIQKTEDFTCKKFFLGNLFFLNLFFNIFVFKKMKNVLGKNLLHNFGTKYTAEKYLVFQSFLFKL